ncbi:MAG: hypothetical protein IJT61_07510 [Bacteroidales bacterium]|nr:hypothetical protein [Bacteroidales bacterium]
MYINPTLFTEFIHSKEILWLGIDFSLSKFTRKGFEITQEQLRTYFNEWNQLVIADQKKYDIRMSFRKPIMSYDLSAVTKANKSVRISNILCENITIEAVHTDEGICDYLRQLSTPQQHRFALIFIVESFDASCKTGAVWVGLFDTVSHEPVLCEKFLKVPSGFGTKNYWGRIFYNILYDIRSYAYYRWESLVKPLVINV